MILVLAGTADGNRLIRRLREEGLAVLACAATPYGASLAAEAGAAQALAGPRDAAELAMLAARATALVDATHPFAQAASAAAREAAARAGVPYFRLVRPPVSLPPHPRLYLVDGWAEAAERAARLGRVIFLAVGTRHLEAFTRAPALAGRRLVARVLPEEESLARCRAAGLSPRDVVAMQGPFSEQLNREMLRHFGAEVLVTKEAGAEGGTAEKVAAALAEGLAVVVVRRPEGTAAGLPEEELVARLKELARATAEGGEDSAADRGAGAGTR